MSSMWLRDMDLCVDLYDHYLQNLRWLRERLYLHRSGLCDTCVRRSVVSILSSVPAFPAFDFHASLRIHANCGKEVLARSSAASREEEALPASSPEKTRSADPPSATSDSSFIFSAEENVLMGKSNAVVWPTLQGPKETGDIGQLGSRSCQVAAKRSVVVWPPKDSFSSQSSVAPLIPSSSSKIPCFVLPPTLKYKMPTPYKNPTLNVAKDSPTNTDSCSWPLVAENQMGNLAAETSPPDSISSSAKSLPVRRRLRSTRTREIAEAERDAGRRLGFGLSKIRRKRSPFGKRKVKVPKLKKELDWEPCGVSEPSCQEDEHDVESEREKPLSEMGVVATGSKDGRKASPVVESGVDDPKDDVLEEDLLVSDSDDADCSLGGFYTAEGSFD